MKTKVKKEQLLYIYTDGDITSCRSNLLHLISFFHVEAFGGLKGLKAYFLESYKNV